MVSVVLLPGEQPGNRLFPERNDPPPFAELQFLELDEQDALC